MGLASAKKVLNTQDVVCLKNVVVDPAKIKKAINEKNFTRVGQLIQTLRD